LESQILFIHLQDIALSSHFVLSVLVDAYTNVYQFFSLKIGANC